MNLKTDVVIIGGGIAALQAARVLGQRFKVHIVTKSELKNSSSYKAQGGIAAVSSPNDHVDLHVADSLQAGVHHHHEENVETLVKSGANVISELIAMGLPVDRKSTGEISLGLEGAHSRSRIIHSGGDGTGRALVEHLLKIMPENVEIHPHEFAYELLLNIDGECIGVRTLHEHTKKTYLASYIIIATGGAGALYSTTSNCSNSFGDGIALAYRAGAEVADMEFVQFHPSLLFVNEKAKGLVSEAVRGAGGRFIDEQGNLLMEGVHPLGDLAPRHITAYEMYKHRKRGKEVYIDISIMTEFTTKFPTITQLCVDNNINLEDGKIPVAPGSHFLMGGIIADATGQTTIPRLFAIGEAACTGVHGANRLASNSLLEGITFGKSMAEFILTSFSTQTNYQKKNIKNQAIPIKLLTKQEIQSKMMESAGIVRSHKGLSNFQKQLPTLRQCSKLRFVGETSEEIEIYFMHIVSSLIVNAAILRTESRGAHIRADYPETNFLWQNNWIITQLDTMKVRKGLYEHHQARRHVEAIF